VEQDHELDAADMMCPKCGAQLELMVGQYEESGAREVCWNERVCTAWGLQRRYHTLPNAVP
jgi:hypothetical protein